ncbi:lysoplasmalogenase family protein [Microbacterium invictum]|uniref:Lysoplasmalogenase family protein n=1 Tax=Microbacterium invictum TaxID=515415 RepID=A0ABZ0VBP7_9MICO|nr:lysoplasmalogenase family protein [Microbacterium invictum]WQB69232.1 lysoplasmalogenase family protein [Microbacterium invictum]
MAAPRTTPHPRRALRPRARGHRGRRLPGGALIAVGGAFFLTSDSILAFDLFWPGAPTGVTGPLVMLTYTLGQGLIALGVVRAISSGRGGTR